MADAPAPDSASGSTPGSLLARPSALRIWLLAARPATLPAAVDGVVVGLGAALGVGAAFRPDTALGCVAVLGTLSVQVFIAPLAAVVVLALIARHIVSRAAFGLFTGIGAACLLVAYLNRRGPGLVAWHTATSAGADEYLDPRPWLAAGLAFAAIGLAAFLWHRRDRTRES